MSVQLVRKHSKAILERINSGLKLPNSKHLQKRFNQSDLFRSFAVRCPVNSVEDDSIAKLVTFRASIGIKDKFICGQCPFQKECKLAFNTQGEESGVDFDSNNLAFFFKKLSELDDNTYNSILSARTSQYNSPQEDRTDKNFIYWGSTLRILDTLEQIQRDVVENNADLTQSFIKQNEQYSQSAQGQQQNIINSKDDKNSKNRKITDIPKFDKNDPKFDEKKSYPYSERKDYQNTRQFTKESKPYERRITQDKDGDETQVEKKPRYRNLNLEEPQEKITKKQIDEDDDEDIQTPNKRGYEGNNSRNFENSRNFDNKSRGFENRPDRGYENRSNNRENYSNNKNFENRSNNRDSYQNNRSSEGRPSYRENFSNNRNFENRSSNRDNYPNNRNYENKPNNRDSENNSGTRGYDNNRNTENRFGSRNFENNSSRNFENRRERSGDFEDRRNSNKQFNPDFNRDRSKGRFDEQTSLKEELKDYENVERNPRFKKEFVSKFSMDQAEPNLDSFESRRQSKRGSDEETFGSPSRNKFNKFSTNDSEGGSNLSDNSFQSFQKEQQTNQTNDSYKAFRKVTPNDTTISTSINETISRTSDPQRQGGRSVRQGKFKIPNSE